MRWTRQQLRTFLEDAAHTEVPEPRAEFVTELESRFRGDRPATTSVVALQRRSTGPSRFLAGAVAAAAVVAAVVVAVDRSPSGELRLVTPASSGRDQEARPLPTSTTGPAATVPMPDPPVLFPSPTAGAAESEREPTSTTGRTRTTDTRPPRTRTQSPPDGQRTTSSSRSDELRLGCRPVSDGDNRGIGCEWSPGPNRTAGFRLWREGGGEGRQVVMAVKDPTIHRYFDRRTVRGATYTYLVEALAGDGRVLARSNSSRTTCC